MKNDLFWEIPSTIDLEAVILKYPPPFKYHIDKFYYIIDYLSKGMDLEDLDSNAGFINLNAHKLQEVIHDYNKYLEYLLDHRVIRTDKKYTVGKKSFGYQINNIGYRNSVKKIPVTYWPMIKRKKREIDILLKEIETTQKAYRHLTKWFNPLLKIDADAAKRKTEELFPEPTGSIRGTKRGKPSNTSKRYKAIQSIDKFANLDFYYSVDENVGRFHSNLTNIKRELRHFITYDGQKLVNVDIKNSQPLFSTLLLNKAFYNENNQLINIFKIPSSLSLLSSINHSYMSIIIMIVKTLEKIDIQNINKYISMVNSGEFYKQISELLYPGMPFDKAKMKILMFFVFFSINRYMGQPRAKPKRDFALHFPGIYEIFKILKRINHTALSHILQRIESEIIIQRVALRISIERPTLPIFTIHDSVATTVGDEDYVASIIEEEVLKLTGLNVLLGKEYWE